MIKSEKSGFRCSNCKARNNCGWSSVAPQPNINPELLYLEPCSNLCEPVNFTVKNCTDEGLIRVFEAAALREQNDKAWNRGEPPMQNTMARRGRRR